MNIRKCNICPRKCNADRTENFGLCGCNDKIKLAKVCLHKWEEPCICGGNGAGAVFFSGCNLKCCYCQNYRISHENFGKEISVERLSEIFLDLQEKGACNIDLVTPTPYVYHIIKALDIVKDKLKIPVVYNCGGYELPETIKLLDGFIDIYLPDFKYYDNSYALKYSGVKNYFEYASESLKEMISQTGKLKYSDSGIMKKGTIIRHLALPNLRHDSIRLMEWISENLPNDCFLISLMSQYTPIPEIKEKYPEINRRITKMEYNSILNRISELGLEGFSQEKSSAVSDYTPDFDLSGF